MSTETVAEPDVLDAEFELKEPLALAKFRQTGGMLPVLEMRQALKEYDEMRDEFRAWLLKKMKLGVHYGYVPGCEPKPDPNIPGNFLVWNAKKSSYQSVPPDQWTPSYGLYKKGADLIVDVTRLVDTYAADMEGWEQLGKPIGTFVYGCYLYPKGSTFVDENLIGEGRGCRKVGQKGGDENNAIKMAKKSAKVDAAINAWGLSDLFTQDLEDLSPPSPPDAPEQDPKAAKAQARGQRVTKENLVQLYKAWLLHFERVDDKESGVAFREWQAAVTGIPPETANVAANWTPVKLAECYGRLEPK